MAECLFFLRQILARLAGWSLAIWLRNQPCDEDILARTGIRVVLLNEENPDSRFKLEIIRRSLNTIVTHDKLWARRIFQNIGTILIHDGQRSTYFTTDRICVLGFSDSVLYRNRNEKVLAISGVLAYWATYARWHKTSKIHTSTTKKRIAYICLDSDAKLKKRLRQSGILE